MMEEEEMDPEIDLGDASPIAELHDFELPSEDEFTDRVRRSIDRREAASSFVDLSVGGFFKLLIDYLSILLDAVFSPPDSEDREKES